MNDAIVLARLDALPKSTQTKVFKLINKLYSSYEKERGKIIPKAGVLKGKIKMSDDFDDPLDFT